ncbi:CalY family protein [Dethiobacter alkaliphilus]|uniref:CalY family protein n=1 Tax=Dethiobacter alkaliphilus TaxID=427926 RepID=UPI0022268F80|nr:CalY family protein [Dethiobacter alkaliphilus]MCW3490441.1 CalY family protein [Dethiobacter alkaliphilus]
MKTRMLMSMMVIALVAALVGGATFAVFTDSSSNTANTFSAGTVELTIGTETTDAVALDNMAPGDVISGSFAVENTGSLELYYVVSANASGDLFGLDADAAVVTITEGGSGVLDSDETAVVSYTVELPLAAGDNYQGVSGDLQFDVEAVQTANHDYVDYLN